MGDIKMVLKSGDEVQIASPLKRVTSVDISAHIGRYSLENSSSLLRLPSDLKGIPKKKPLPRFTTVG